MMQIKKLALIKEQLAPSALQYFLALKQLKVLLLAHSSPLYMAQVLSRKSHGRRRILSGAGNGIEGANGASGPADDALDEVSVGNGEKAFADDVQPNDRCGDPNSCEGFFSFRFVASC